MSAYHPDPEGIGWFTAVTVRRWLASRYLPWWRVIDQGQAEQMTGCLLTIYPPAVYTRPIFQPVDGGGELLPMHRAVAMTVPGVP